MRNIADQVAVNNENARFMSNNLVNVVMKFGVPKMRGIS
jgi:hypothetical protein